MRMTSDKKRTYCNLQQLTALVTPAFQHILHPNLRTFDVISMKSCKNLRDAKHENVLRINGIGHCKVLGLQNSSKNPFQRFEGNFRSVFGTFQLLFRRNWSKRIKNFTKVISNFILQDTRKSKPVSNFESLNVSAFLSVLNPRLRVFQVLTSVHNVLHVASLISLDYEKNQLN